MLHALQTQSDCSHSPAHSHHSDDDDDDDGSDENDGADEDEGDDDENNMMVSKHMGLDEAAFVNSHEGHHTMSFHFIIMSVLPPSLFAREIHLLTRI